MAIWIAGIIFIFLHGNYLGGRVPDIIYFESFVELLFSVGLATAKELVWNIFLAGTIWFIFYSAGDILIRKFGSMGVTTIERLLLSTGLGAGVASLALLGLGVTGCWSPIALRIVFVVGVVAGLGVLIHSGWCSRHGTVSEEARDLILPTQASLSVWAQVALVVIAAAIVLNLLATVAPEIFYDSLVYHLALPKLYLLRGRILPTPQNLYSGLPFGMEMLYGLALALSNEHLAMLLHCSFGWAAALTLGAWLHRYASKNAAIFGILIFSLCPVVLAEGWQSGVDLGTAFYFSLTLVAVSHALDATDDVQSRRWSIIGGILIGFSFATKYTALSLGAAFVLTHGWLRKGDGRSIRDTVWMAVVAVVTVSPWLIKNLLFYGNPFYPFLNNFMGSVSPAHWDKFLGDAHSQNPTAILGSLNGWIRLLRLPWDMTIDRYFDYRISLIYLLLFPGILLSRWGGFRRDSSIPVASKAILTITLIGYVAWSISSTITRFLVPTLLLASGVLALAVEKINMTPWLRQAVWFLAIGVSMCNFITIYLDGIPAPGFSGKWAVVQAKQSNADYLKAEHAGYGQPPYAAIEFINQKLPQNSRVVFLGESRAYYCERDFIAATVFDHNPFWIAARTAKSAVDLHNKLRSLGVTHVFINAFQLYSDAGFSAVLPRDVATSPIFLEFWASYLRKEFEDKEITTSGQISSWLVVYGLQDTPAKNPTNYQDNPILDTLNILRNENH